MQISRPQPHLSIFISCSGISKHFEGQSTFSPFSVPLSGNSCGKRKKSFFSKKILNNSIKAV